MEPIEKASGSSETCCVNRKPLRQASLTVSPKTGGKSIVLEFGWFEPMGGKN